MAKRKRKVRRRRNPPVYGRSARKVKVHGYARQRPGYDEEGNLALRGDFVRRYSRAKKGTANRLPIPKHLSRLTPQGRAVGRLTAAQERAVRKRWELMHPGASPGRKLNRRAAARAGAARRALLKGVGSVARKNPRGRRRRRRNPSYDIMGFTLDLKDVALLTGGLVGADYFGSALLGLVNKGMTNPLPSTGAAGVAIGALARGAVAIGLGVGGKKLGLSHEYAKDLLVGGALATLAFVLATPLRALGLSEIEYALGGFNYNSALPSHLGETMYDLVSRGTSPSLSGLGGDGSMNFGTSLPSHLSGPFAELPYVSGLGSPFAALPYSTY